MAFGDVAVVQTGGVHAEDAIFATATAFVGLDGDAVPDSQLVDVWAEGHHGAGPFVTWRELSEWRLCRKRMRLNLEVGSTRAAHGDFDEHFATARRRHGLVDHAEVVRPEQDRGPHFCGQCHPDSPSGVRPPASLRSLPCGFRGNEDRIFAEELRN